MRTVGPWIITFIALALSITDAAAAGSRAVLLMSDNRTPWREARKVIERYGGRVDIAIPPGILVGDTAFIPLTPRGTYFF